MIIPPLLSLTKLLVLTRQNKIIFLKWESKTRKFPAMLQSALNW